MSGGAYFGPAIAQRAEFLSSAWGRGTVPSAGTRQVRPGRSTASTCTRMAAVIPPSLTSILPHGRRHGTAVTHAAHRLWTAVRRCAAFLARARAPSARGSPPRHVRDCDTALVAHARTGRGPVLSTPLLNAVVRTEGQVGGRRPWTGEGPVGWWPGSPHRHAPASGS
ncbi:hypothetical protein SAMN06272765_2397 [Streptomyces sp. Ag109_G2-15]|nr:hypothetical protein SAMN06272765_2397 [Streptomyces sp. Ag109_G2-15]